MILHSDTNCQLLIRLSLNRPIRTTTTTDIPYPFVDRNSFRPKGLTNYPRFIYCFAECRSRIGS